MSKLHTPMSERAKFEENNRVRDYFAETIAQESAERRERASIKRAVIVGLLVGAAIGFVSTFIF